jgi:UDP-N-acetylglucosamine 1-carboxyvinyltransferase
MEKFIVEGGHTLKGSITPSGNKNAVLPILAATLLTDEKITLCNIPRIKDVEVMVNLLESIGSSVVWTDDCTLEVETGLPSKNRISINEEYASEIRASILLAGPLLARGKSVHFPPPGGDVIGRRRLDTHFYAFESLGARIRTDKHGFFIEANELKGTTLFLDEPSVTATENAIMASIYAAGSTSIKNAASEPHVQDLIGFLNNLGACISGSESNILEIKCTRELEGGSWKVTGDHIEVGSFISLAAVTGSEIIIKDAGPSHLNMIQYYFSKLGVKITIAFWGNSYYL